MLLKKQQSSQNMNDAQVESEENDLSSSPGSCTSQIHFNRVVSEKIVDYFPERIFEDFAFLRKKTQKKLKK
jgi:hypothetical protein